MKLKTTLLAAALLMAGSLAHAEMLAAQGVIGAADLADLTALLPAPSAVAA